MQKNLYYLQCSTSQRSEVDRSKQLQVHRGRATTQTALRHNLTLLRLNQVVPLPVETAHVLAHQDHQRQDKTELWNRSTWMTWQIISSGNFLRLGSATTQEIDRFVHLDQPLSSQLEGVVNDPADMSHEELLEYFHNFYNVIMTTARARRASHCPSGSEG